MKKGLSFFLIVLLLICASCSKSLSDSEKSSDFVSEISPQESLTEESPAKEQSTAVLDPILEEYLSDLAAVDTPVRQYGEDTSYLLMEEDLVARILYPEGELVQLTEAIEAWIEETISYYYEEMAAGSFADSGESSELTVEYESFLINENLVGITFSGVFMRPYMAHPVDIIKTFNANLETGEVLKLEDFLLEGGYEKLYQMVVDQAGDELDWADENLLNHWLLTPDGLEITLARGEYLPMSAGTCHFHYSYESLHDILVFPEDQLSETEPEKSFSEINSPESVPAAIIDPSKPMVALTFDDGPSKHTNRLLDAFAAHGGKGTFFVVGNILDAQAETLKRTANEGHEIGGHSWNHRQLTKLDDTELANQIMNTRAKIFEITGTDTTILRPPYGSCNDTVKEICAELGIVIVNWSLDTLDWKNKNADTIYNVIMNEVEDGAIILCHDLHGTTVDAMERVIPDLIAQGYQLVTVSELLANSEKPVQAGTVYYKQ